MKIVHRIEPWEFKHCPNDKNLFKSFVSLNKQKSVVCFVDLDVVLPKLTKNGNHFATFYQINKSL